MIRNILANKSTFITDQNEAANFGECVALDLFKKSDKKSRILFKFDLTEIPQIDKAVLVVRNMESVYDAPANIQIEICPIISDWDEGSGRYQYPEEYYNFDEGYCNWNNRKRNVSWTNSGGDFDNINKLTYDLDKPADDIEIDVTDILQYATYGFLIKLTDSLEDDLEDYFIKRFNKPFLRIFYEDCFTDNRNNFNFDTTNNLYIYNINTANNITNVMAQINGVEYIVSGPAPENSFHIETQPILTSSSGYISGSISEIWKDSDTNKILYSGTINNYNYSLNDNYSNKEIYVNFLNCNNKKFDFDDIIKVKIKMTEVIRENNVRIQNNYFSNITYSVVAVMNKDVVIPRDPQYTKASFDSEYYYFNIYSEDLQPGWYKILIYDNGIRMEDFCQIYINPSE